MSETEQIPVEFEDVQGLVRFAFKHHTEASYLLLHVRHPAAARAWIGRAPVSNAARLDQLPQTVLQLAFTHEGLRALGVSADITKNFSKEFVAGMAGDANRARRLGDVGPNEPKHWQWGVAERVPDAVALLYAMPGCLAEWQRTIESQCAPGFEVMACLPTSDMGGTEPFGFIDGISQPQPDWSRRRPAIDQTQLSYTNLACLGEFLLGYPNEYGLYTPRPLVDRQVDVQGILPEAEDTPGKRDLGRNGSYLVLRQLRQDVAGFWQALDRYADGNAGERVRLAEAMVGRTLEGEPLVGLLHDAIEGDTGAPQPDLNGFTYRSDPEGIRCPLGAHIRRTNPRNADLPPGGSGLLARLERTLGFNAEARALDLVASTRFHRIIRRGREYGAMLPPGQALTAPSETPESGLQFVCLGASIERQFEFIQSAWVMSTKFDGLRDETDPLLGNRVPGFGEVPTDEFSIPQSDGADRRVTALPRFVTVLGGAYFFLPGLRALRFLSTVGTKDK